MKKIIGKPMQTNSKMIELIKKTKINNYYIKNHEDFRKRIVEDINIDDDVLDIGKGMLKGLGNFLAGPGLAIGAVAFVKLFNKLTAFAKDAFQSIRNIWPAVSKDIP